MNGMAMKLIRRLARGQLKRSLYLVYHYLYLYALDIRYAKDFSNSQSSEEAGLAGRATGNFPTGPRFIRKFLNLLPKGSSIVDVGCGSGVPLFVAHQMGFGNLRGVELSAEAYRRASENLHGLADVLHADAFDVNYEGAQALLLFKPFMEEAMTKDFIRTKIPESVVHVITVNINTAWIRDALCVLGFQPVFEFNHPIFENFNGILWKRNSSGS